MEMLIQMLWATVTERLASASSVSTTLVDRGAMSVLKVGRLKDIKCDVTIISANACSFDLSLVHNSSISRQLVSLYHIYIYFYFCIYTYIYTYVSGLIYEYI